MNQGSAQPNKTLRWIGDLDHPFYNDERNRFVWYESSAIGFQVLLLGMIIMAGAVLWVGGGQALPYVAALFTPVIGAAITANVYIKRNLAECEPTINDAVRPRGLLAIGGGVFLYSGLLRALIDLRDPQTSGFAGGLADGLFVGVLFWAAAAGVFALRAFYGRRRPRSSPSS